MTTKKLRVCQEKGRRARFNAESDIEVPNPPQEYTRTEKAFWQLGWEEEDERLRLWNENGPRIGDFTLSVIRSGYFDKPRHHIPLPRTFS